VASIPDAKDLDGFVEYFFIIRSRCSSRTKEAQKMMRPVVLAVNAYVDFFLFFFGLGVIVLFFR